MHNAVAQTMTPQSMNKPERPLLKTNTLNLRLAPATKVALKDIGRRESRSMVNALEWLVAEYYRVRNLTPPGVEKARVSDAER